MGSPLRIVVNTLGLALLLVFSQPSFAQEEATETKKLSKKEAAAARLHAEELINDRYPPATK